MNGHYNNNEINLMFDKISLVLGEHTSLLNEIKVQTTKTNGKVRNLQIWRSGQVAGLAVVMAVVIPLVVYIFLMSIHNVENNLDQHVAQMNKAIGTPFELKSNLNN